MTEPSLTDFEAFRLGNGGPVNSTGNAAALQQALLSKMSAADLRRRAREEQKSLAAYMAEREKRQRAAARPAPAKPAAPAPNRFADQPDHYVMQAAVHRSSPEADRIEARAELAARGYTVTDGGIVSKSHRKSN